MKQKTREAINALLAAIDGTTDQFDPEVATVERTLREEDNV